MENFTVIGYDTRAYGLAVFKCFDVELPSGRKMTTKEVQDKIAEQAERCSHIIYTVVPTSLIGF